MFLMFHEMSGNIYHFDVNSSRTWSINSISIQIVGSLSLPGESLLDFHQQANEPKGLRKKVGVYIEGFRHSLCYMKRWKSSLNHWDPFSSIFRNQASDSPGHPHLPTTDNLTPLTLGLDRHWLAIFSSFGRLLPAKAQVKGLRTPWTKASKCSTIKHPLKPWRTLLAAGFFVLKTLTCWKHQNKVDLPQKMVGHLPKIRLRIIDVFGSRPFEQTRVRLDDLSKKVSVPSIFVAVVHTHHLNHLDHQPG